MTMLMTKVVVVALLQASRTACKRSSGTSSCTFVTPEERMIDRSRLGNIGSSSSSKRFVKTFCAADTEIPPPKVWLNMIIAVPMGIKSSGSTFCTAISGSCKPAPAPCVRSCQLLIIALGLFTIPVRTESDTRSTSFVSCQLPTSTTIQRQCSARPQTSKAGGYSNQRASSDFR